jgi:hypothetical protein
VSGKPAGGPGNAICLPVEATSGFDFAIRENKPILRIWKKGFDPDHRKRTHFSEARVP